MAKNEVKTNPYLIRYKPDYRFTHEKVEVTNELAKLWKSDSQTDKEAYRVTLASMRGTLSQNLGSSNVGSYSLKDGNYDRNLDFSYLNRPDLTIVQIDDYIQNFKSQLEKADETLKNQIEAEIERAEERKAVLQEQQKSDTSSSE